jgi:hypothetical protein
VKEDRGLVVPTRVEEREAPTAGELLEIWRAALPMPPDEIVGVVAQADRPLSAEEIADHLDRQPRGDSWNTRMAMLRANGFICEEGRGRWTLGAHTMSRIAAEFCPPYLLGVFVDHDVDQGATASATLRPASWSSHAIRPRRRSAAGSRPGAA